MIEFAQTCFFLLITPGPGVLSVAGVGSAFGFRAGFAYLWGLCLGNFAVGMAVATGLAVLLFTVPYLRNILLFASIAYLVYLAAKIAFSGSKVALITPEKAPGFRNGITLQAINPKAYAVNTTLFSGFNFMPDNYTLEVIFKVLILNAFWIPIHFLWLGMGVYLKALNLPPRAQSAINITMAISMLIVVALAFGSQPG